MSTLVIMAAGLGVRFGGLKQLAPVGPHQEAILDFSAHDAWEAGFEQMVLVIRSEIEDEMRGHVRRRWPGSVPVEFVLQDREPTVAALSRAKPLGTAHAVLSARAAVGDVPFAVINADDLYGPGGYGLLAGHLRSGPAAEHALVGFRLADTVPAGGGAVMRAICEVNPDGRLSEIVETRVEGVPVDGLASMNMWGFRPGIFDALARAVADFVASGQATGDAEVLLPAVVGGEIAAGRALVRVLPAVDRWVGLTYDADLTRARQAVAELVAAGVEPSPVWR